MRRRSGALHSDSEEEFLRLAELSHQKTGCFYDQALNAELNKNLKSFQSSPRKEKAVFMEGFDYEVADRQKQEELKQLEAKNTSILVNMAIICDCQQNIKSIFVKMWPDQQKEEDWSPQRKNIDLHIITSLSQDGKLYCFKIWIIQSSLSSNPIYCGYLKRSAKVLDFSKSASFSMDQAMKQISSAIDSLTK